MISTGHYLFTSERLGFRPWADADLDTLSAITADPEVMAFFPDVLSREQAAALLARMQAEFTDRGFCYFAVERLDNGRCIGFTGLSDRSFRAGIVPCTDLGWRLARSEWRRGFATEGAVRCMRYAFETLGLKEVCAIAPEINVPSVGVMRKAGMTYVRHFDHPDLAGKGRLQRCVLYKAAMR